MLNCVVSIKLGGAPTKAAARSVSSCCSMHSRVDHLHAMPNPKVSMRHAWVQIGYMCMCSTLSRLAGLLMVLARGLHFTVALGDANTMKRNVHVQANVTTESAAPISHSTPYVRHRRQGIHVHSKAWRGCTGACR